MASNHRAPNPFLVKISNSLNIVYNIYMYTLQYAVPYIKILVISSIDLIMLCI